MMFLLGSQELNLSSHPFHLTRYSTLPPLHRRFSTSLSTSHTSLPTSGRAPSLSLPSALLVCCHSSALLCAPTVSRSSTAAPWACTAARTGPRFAAGTCGLLVAAAATIASARSLAAVVAGRSMAVVPTREPASKAAKRLDSSREALSVFGFLDGVGTDGFACGAAAAAASSTHGAAGACSPSSAASSAASSCFTAPCIASDGAEPRAAPES